MVWKATSDWVNADENKDAGCQVSGQGITVVPPAKERGMVGIKVGDRVLIRTTWQSTRDNQTTWVDKITKAGKIRLENGMLFSSSGTKKESCWGYFVLFKVEEK